MMEALHIITTWILTLGYLGAVVLLIIAAKLLRAKFPGEIEANWRSAIMPSIAFLLLHLGLYWFLPVFWTNLFNSSGFILMQLIAVAGFYTVTLKSKPATAVGQALVLVAIVGLGLITYHAYMETPGVARHDITLKPMSRVDKVVVIVPASGPSEIVPTPGQADIATEGLIWVYTSNGNRYPSYKGNRTPIPVRTSTLQFECRTPEGEPEKPCGPVKVTVSRW